MGAPKQKWTAEEEAALRAGVIKHGAGKWRTILKDPEFSSVLYLRSNVDLKDKWRNMSVIVNGWVPQKPNSKVPVKRMHHVSKQEDNGIFQSDENGADVQYLASASGLTQSAPPRRGTKRLDNLIVDAIATMKEPGGSNKTAIATYIEEQYLPPQDFKRMLSSKLKHLTTNGKLIKVKRRYRIAPSSAFSERRRKQIVSPKTENFRILTRAQIELELAKMRTGMTPQEAAATAARAVADAEAAIAEAEEAAREAEAAEADAEAAQAFADAALKTTKGQTPPKMMIRV